MTDTTVDSTETVLVLNPGSGTGDHETEVRDRATLRGYDVRTTQHEYHAVELAESAAEAGATEVVAIGGDGTLNEVVRGVDAAGALDTVTVAVVPTGTGNDFAQNIGITGVDDAFRILEEGERRRIDLGRTDAQPFVNSCVAGITAAASGETSSELKSQFGVLAYVLTTLRMVPDYSGIDIRASIDDGSSEKTVWEGTATVILVGNGRRFSLSGSEQANLEDGLFDVTVVEDVDSFDFARDRIAERLLDEEGEHITRFFASSLDVQTHQEDTVTYSFDGEMVDLESLHLRNCARAVEMPVGDGYEPEPGVE